MISLSTIQISYRCRLHFQFIKDFNTKICSTKSKILLVQFSLLMCLSSLLLMQTLFEVTTTQIIRLQRCTTSLVGWTKLAPFVLLVFDSLGFYYLVILKLHYRIMSMVESGLILKWYNDYMSKENKCDKSLSSIHHTQAKLETTKGPFIVLSVGLTVSTAVFFLEICAAKFIRKNY